MLAGLSLLVPSIADLLGLARALLTGLVLWGCGRWAVRDAAPEVQLVAGWGIACLALTLWGVVTPVTLAVPGTALVAAGVAGLALRRPGGDEWRALGRITALAAPVLLLLAGARPVLIDSFSHWLPNAAYLVDQGRFPADDRAASFALYPAFPYNLQLVAFLSALGLDRLPAGALIHANVILQLATALLLARLVARLETAPRAAPGWGAAAAGLLACWWLNPGFGPEIAFADYGDVGTGVGLAMSGWLALRLLRHDDASPLAVALALAALINVKQADLVLVMALVGSAGGLALLQRDRVVLARLLVAPLPALVLYAAWRWYVGTHLTGGENELMPLARWRFQELSTIAVRIATVWAEKITYFGILAAVVVAGAVRWTRGNRDPATGLAMLLLGAAVLFNLFLVFIYVAHFDGVMSANAQSYYRFNTQLALLLMTALVLLLREWVGLWLAGGRWRRAVPALAVIAALAIPLGFFERVRFDLRRARHAPWSLAAWAAPKLAPGDRLAVVATGATRDTALALGAAISLLAPRVAVVALRDDGAAVVPSLAAGGFDRLLVTCAGALGPELPADAAGLLAWDGARWQLRGSWPHALRPGALFGERRAGELFGCR